MKCIVSILPKCREADGLVIEVLVLVCTLIFKVAWLRKAEEQSEFTHHGLYLKLWASLFV